MGTTSPSSGWAVITASSASIHRAPLLRHAYESLQRQTLPWQWYIQVDNDEAAWEAIQTFLPQDDDRVHIAVNGRQMGAAISRNLAFSRSHEPLIISLDDDDELMPNALQIWQQQFDADPLIGWVAGASEDIWPDGEVGFFPPQVPPGHCAAGVLPAAWLAPESLFPVVPTAVAWRRSLLAAAGGWHGLPQGEDFGLVMSATQISDGFVTHEPVYRYRKHEHQMLEGENFHQYEPAVRIITWQRSRHLADLLQPMVAESAK